MLCLRSPDGTEQQLVGNIVLGRGSHDCLSDPLISRQQLQLDCVCAEVVQLTNVGLNPIIVERQLVPENTRTLVEAASTSPASGNLTPNWHVTDLLEKGDSTCLQRNSRFYLASLQDSTTFTIVRHSGNADGGSSAKSLAAAVPDWQQQQQVKSSADSQSQADQVAADAALAAALAAAEEHEEQHHSQQHRGQPLNKSTAEDSDHNRPTKKPRLDDVPETAGHGQTAAAAAATAGPSSNSTTHIPAIGDGPFCLLAVRGLSSAHNAGFLGAKLRDLVVSPGSSSSSSSSLNAGSSSSSSSMRVNRLTFVLASNYMIDMGWLLSACPDIIHADKVLVVHGLQGDRAAAVAAEAAAAGLNAPRFCAHAPPLPLAFGTHHSKGFILGYDDGGVRVIIHTANYIYADCNNKTQGLWYQDFPPKDESSPESSQFEDSLMDYVRCLHLPGSWLSQVTSLIKAADFSSSRVALVASVPGYHTGPLKLHAYGHMRLRALLQQQQQQQQKGSSSSCVMQCSSLGSLDVKWLLQEFMASLTAGTTTAGGATTDAAGGTGGSSSSNAFARMVNASRAQTAAAGSSATAIKTPLYIVWPSVSEVQHSREGWSAGYSIPGPAKNVTKGFLSRYWCRFGGEPVGRQSAMPHIKSYGMFTTTTTQQAQAQQQQQQQQQAQQGQQQYEVDPPQQQQQQGQGQQQPNISPELSWWLVTSHNLSKAAWGALQVCQRGQYRGQPQLMIRSYELGVLAAPQLEENYLKHRHRGYSCTAARKLPSKDDTDTQQQQQQQQQDDNFNVKFYAWQAGQPQQQQQVADHTAATTINNKNKSSNCNSSSITSRIVSVPLPVPYRLPPQQYTEDDSPWCVDVQFSGLDGFGYACGEAPFKAYGNRQPAD